MPKHRTNLKFDPGKQAQQLANMKTSDLILLLVRPEELVEFVFDDEVDDRTLPIDELLTARQGKKVRHRDARAAIADELDRRLPIP